MSIFQGAILPEHFRTNHNYFLYILLFLWDIITTLHVSPTKTNCRELLFLNIFARTIVFYFKCCFAWNSFGYLHVLQLNEVFQVHGKSSKWLFESIFQVFFFRELSVLFSRSKSLLTLFLLRSSWHLYDGYFRFKKRVLVNSIRRLIMMHFELLYASFKVK